MWAVYCLDGPDAAPSRETARPDHSARLRGAPEPLFYGPLLADDGNTPIGSLLLVEAADRAAVERFVAQDPFVRAGVWERVEIAAFAPSTNSSHRLTGSEHPS